MLEANAVQVLDLGVDVDAQTFLSNAAKHKVSILGISAFTTSSRKELKKLIDLIRNQDSPAKIILAGGAALTAATAKNLGADGYAKDAVGAVTLVKKFLIQKKIKPHEI